MTTRNPFTAALATAAEQGYIGSPRTRRTVSKEVPMATPKQNAFMLSLLQERDFSSEARPAWQARIEELHNLGDDGFRAMTQRQASAFIEYALGMPMRGRTPEAETQADIPAGYYAVPNSMLNGGPTDPGISFFSVDRPKSGTWEGYTFVSRKVGGEQVRMNRRQQDEAKSAIREFGFQEASRLYGLKLGHCGVCGRELTNETSREEGIGPKCAGKMGW
jgi:hypothetical protein